MKKYVKKFYYQNIKPNIDKVMSNPGYFIPTGNILGAVGSYFYRPDFDARKAKTKDEAYEMARSTGAKTFIWNGGHYNTDYKGDSKKTLVQQKQEELDTYGITNEQTRNKNLFEKNLHDNLLPAGYDTPIYRVLKAQLGIKDSQLNVYNNMSKIESYSEMRDILKNNILDNVGNKSSQKRMIDNIDKMSDKDLSKMKDDANNRIDSFGMLLGYPQKNNTFSISKYKPDGATEAYYLKQNILPTTLEHDYSKDIDEHTSMLNRLKTNEKKNKNNIFFPNKAVQKLKEYKQNLIDVGNNKKGNHIVLDSNLGFHTLGISDEYKSYYDKWDINPFGSGNDKPLIELGTPLNIYDRKYFKKQGGNMKYTSLFKLGGAAKILLTGGTSPNPWRKVSGSFNGVNYQGEVFLKKWEKDPSVKYIIYKDNNGKKFSRDPEGVITYDPKSTTQDSIAFQSILNANGFNYGKGPATQSLDLLNSKVKEIEDDPWFKGRGQKK